MLYIVAIVTFLCHENNYVLTTTYLIWPFWMFGYWKAFQRPLSEVGSVWSTDTNCGQVWSLFSFVWRGFCMYYARPTYDIWTLHPISESSQEPDCIKNLWAFWAGLYLRYVRLVRIKTIIVVIKKRAFENVHQRAAWCSKEHKLLDHILCTIKCELDKRKRKGGLGK